MDSDAGSGPTRRSTAVWLATALAVLLPLAGGALRAANSMGAQLRDEPLAPLGLAAVLAGPGVLALLARRRPALYLAAGAMCVPLFAVSIVTLPLLPLGVVLATAARFRRGRVGALGAVFLALAGPALAVGLFVVTFAHQDGRCWTTGDGTTTITPFGSGTTITSSGSAGSSTTCSSDVVTGVEALGAVVVLTLGVAGLARVAQAVSPANTADGP